MTSTARSEKPRCKATNRQGQPCGRYPMKGSTVCRAHGGRSPKAVAKATERVLQAQLQGELTKRGWEAVSDPYSAILELAGEVLAFLDLARARLSELSTWDSLDDKGAEQVKATVTVYERALDRAAKVLDSIIGRDVQSKAAQVMAMALQPSTADVLGLLDGVLARLELSDEQRALVPAAIEATLREKR